MYDGMIIIKAKGTIAIGSCTGCVYKGYLPASTYLPDAFTVIEIQLIKNLNIHQRSVRPGSHMNDSIYFLTCFFKPFQKYISVHPLSHGFVIRIFVFIKLVKIIHHYHISVIAMHI